MTIRLEREKDVNPYQEAELYWLAFSVTLWVILRVVLKMKVSFPIYVLTVIWGGVFIPLYMAYVKAEGARDHETMFRYYLWFGSWLYIPISITLVLFIRIFIKAPLRYYLISCFFNFFLWQALLILMFFITTPQF